MRGAGPLVALIVAGAVASCGTDDGGAPAVSVAPLAIGGFYGLDGLDVESATQDLPDPVEFYLDAEFGELRIDTACGSLLGSFTALDDGTAGMTVAGGIGRSCGDEAAEQQRALIEALSRVDTWRDGEAGIVLTSPVGDEVVLGR